jgi:hypothetical protein
MDIARTSCFGYCIQRNTIPIIVKNLQYKARSWRHLLVGTGRF